MGRKKTTFQWEQGDDDLPEEEEAPSARATHKREENERKELVKHLLALSKSDRAALPLSDLLRESLEEAHRLRAKRKGKSGYRRHLLVIASILRDEGTDALQEALNTSTK